ncbi:PepSY-associated TM helix domain-containing protein [Sinomicrobium sp. M5D2P17]
MSQRVYNILFHTHTISGIIISALLYVIFFTGSISFLRDEINAWERNEPISEGYFGGIDFDDAFNALEKEQQLYSRDIRFTHRFFERRVAVFMSSPKDTTIKEERGGRRRNFFYLDMENYAKRDYGGNYSLGEFFYRLHFFAPLNFQSRSGYYLAGLVAFLFLFAVVTGVIVHWKKIVSGFYVFRPGTKWKTIWTDAHVALGMIGLPYQFMFAFTGVYFIVGYTVMLAPVSSVLFNEDNRKMEEVMRYENPADYAFTGEAPTGETSINYFINETTKKWPEAEINGLQVYNYGDANMHVKVVAAPSFREKLIGEGYLTFRAGDGKIVDEKDPFGKISYIEGSSDILARLHFGDFGGYGMKVIYLALGFITCFVILSGVLIWLVARDKKNVSQAKRNFNNWLVRVYMSACLAMYPVTAFTFIMVKLFADDYGDNRKQFIYSTFFWSWLVLSVLLLFKKSTHFTNKTTLILGGCFGLLVPVASGIKTGNWPWVSVANGYSQIFVVDMFWISLSVIAFAVVFKLKRRALA